MFLRRIGSFHTLIYMSVENYLRFDCQFYGCHKPFLVNGWSGMTGKMGLGPANRNQSFLGVIWPFFIAYTFAS